MKILITGANRGLGLSLSEKGLANGHDIIANVRDAANISKELAALTEKYKDRIRILEMDVADEPSVIKAAETLSHETEAIDGIINNAAILIGSPQVLDDLDLQDLYRSFEVNTFGTVRVVKYFLPLLYKGKEQVIVNISSEAGAIINAFPTNYPYSMSKTAVNMFSERLREYLKPRDIRVYAIHPGWMQTDMGGKNAAIPPETTAAGIYDIIEGKKKVYSKIAFISYEGKPMPL